LKPGKQRASRLWISPYGDKTPIIHPAAFVDISARIIGDVTVEEEACIMPMAVLRADSGRILVGARSSILDLVLLEAPLDHPVVIGEETLVSHGAIIHGAHIEDRVLIGIGAIILDGASIATGSIIGVGSLVTAGTIIPPNSLALGVPARIVRETTEAERKGLLPQLQEIREKVRNLSLRLP
jgi:carbonic anhydrase/acetyltransferase-like protein (isoleucine patch superfamily)